MECRELHLYSEKVEENDVKNLFNMVIKAKIPLFGFLSFRDILSINAVTLVIKRSTNTVKLYVKEKESIDNVSALVFPFRVCDSALLKLSKGSFFPVPKLFVIKGGTFDVLDFMLKEDIEELTISVTKFLGQFVGFATLITTNGRKGKAIVTSPQKFLMINLEKNPSIYIELLEPLPKQMSMTSNFPVFEEKGIKMGVDNYDPLQHTVIAGTSGSGKSKGLYVMLRALEAKYKDNARIILVDPHGEFVRLMPHARVVNFVNNYVEPLDVGRDNSPMLTQLVSQLISSSIGKENKYSERVLFYTIHLLTSIGKLELKNISSLLTDSSVKAQYVSLCDNDEVKRFFDEEFNDINIHHFNDAILPILNFIGEYELYLGSKKKRESLLDLMNSNRITIVSFDPSFFGKRMISFLAGAIINQMYILAITGKIQKKPTILVVDEFPRVETRVIKDILSETRKFNLFAYLSCQYLGQLSKEVLDSIISNTHNIIAFKINRQDATLLSSIMEIKLEEYFKKSRATTELEESKKDMFVRLHRRECIVRLFDGERYLLPMKLKVVDAKQWGYKEQFAPVQNAVNEPDDESDGNEGSTPLRYKNFQQSNEEDVPQSQQNYQQEKQQEEKDTEMPPEKPSLPNPMTERLWLRETPGTIYGLEKAKMKGKSAERPIQEGKKEKD